jgi:hypothetical protein
MYIDREKMGLPFRPFLYTLSQIQDLLALEDLTPLLYYDSRTIGIHNPKTIRTINIMPDGVQPEWRVEEAELIRWMRHTGFKILLRFNPKR